MIELVIVSVIWSRWRTSRSAAGLGFFLWNRGATKVSAGVLAVMNNGYMPIAVLAGVLLYNESAAPLRLSVGAGLFVNGRGPTADPATD